MHYNWQTIIKIVKREKCKKGNRKNTGQKMCIYAASCKFTPSTGKNVTHFLTQLVHFLICKETKVEIVLLFFSLVGYLGWIPLKELAKKPGFKLYLTL